ADAEAVDCAGDRRRAVFQDRHVREGGNHGRGDSSLCVGNGRADPLFSSATENRDAALTLFTGRIRAMIPERYASVTYALFRIVFGYVFFLYGSQKMFGWFGGPQAQLMSLQGAA